MAGRLEGKVAIITGATSGIGEATARRFAEEGATVLLAGRSVDKGEALAKELGGRAIFQRADVMREADIAALVDTAMQRFGRLDVLFNNAGAPTPGTFDDVTESQFNYAMQLLLGSVVFGIKHAFDPKGLLNPGKVIPTLNRCAEYGKMLVRGGQIAHPDLPRF